MIIKATHCTVTTESGGDYALSMFGRTTQPEWHVSRWVTVASVSL